MNSHPDNNDEDQQKIRNILNLEFKLFDDRDNFIIGRYKVEQQNTYNYYYFQKITPTFEPYKDVVYQMLKVQLISIPDITF